MVFTNIRVSNSVEQLKHIKHMIHSFSCKNFYSFNNLTTVSFVVSEKAPHNEGYFRAKSGNRLSKIEAAIGPNASGKTNLLKVLPFLKWLITGSFNLKPSDPLLFKPFLFANNKHKTTEVSADFEIDGDIYTYSFDVNKERIVSEGLRIKSKTNEKLTSKKMFSRHWNDKDRKYELDNNNFNLPKEFENSMRTNASVVSVAVRFNHKNSQKIFDYWQKIQTNVGEAGWIGDSLLPNAAKQLIKVFDFYSENETIKKEMDKLLSRFDLGLGSFDVEKEKKGNEISMSINGVHTFDGQTNYRLPIQYESSGTKQLSVLSEYILLALANGWLVVIDEFDVNLHPEVVLTLVELFIHQETNPHDAQLLFSTHSHRVLTRLDKYQITLTEKNEKGESEAWRLDDVSNVRADDNYYEKYITGAYGAIPKL